MKKLNVCSHREVITNPDHPTINTIWALHQRNEREKTGLFYSEGLRFVAQALTGGHVPEVAVYSPELIKVCGRRLVRDLMESGTPCLSVTADVLRSIALNADPQGIGIVARQRWQALEEVDPHARLCWIVLDTVQSPGNLGTIIRTGEAVGAAGLIVLDDLIDVYHPASVRATMGAVFAREFRFVRASQRNFLRWKNKHRCALVGTSPTASVMYRDVRFGSPLLIWMGGERKGLSEKQQSVCDTMVRLPMTGRSDSLNLAVATGIMLYEVHRQRSPSDSPSGVDLS